MNAEQKKEMPLVLGITWSKGWWAPRNASAHLWHNYWMLTRSSNESAVNDNKNENYENDNGNNSNCYC